MAPATPPSVADDSTPLEEQRRPSLAARSTRLSDSLRPSAAAEGISRRARGPPYPEDATTRRPRIIRLPLVTVPRRTAQAPSCGLTQPTPTSLQRKTISSACEPPGEWVLEPEIPSEISTFMRPTIRQLFGSNHPMRRDSA